MSDEEGATSRVSMCGWDHSVGRRALSVLGPEGLLGAGGGMASTLTKMVSNCWHVKLKKG